MDNDDLWNAFIRRTVFGFYGNTESCAAEAEEHGFHREGLSGDWLGRGFYFWQDAPVRAWLWAERVVELEARKNPEAPEEEPMVLFAVLDYTEDWIDLIESGPWFDHFRQVAEELERQGALPEQRSELGASVRHERDYAVVEAAIDQILFAGGEVDAIKCAFIEGMPVCENSAIYDKAHLQIVVRVSTIVRNHSRIGRIE